jgi:23S rRNA (cytosine1962-C5)-methyltransferase
VFVKIRPRQASRLEPGSLDKLAPKEPDLGAPDQSELVVREGQARFWVHPGGGLSTGLFLDQRENRTWLSQVSEGRRVLNLFGYTGSFSIVAALGGAARTVTVDASQRALELARRNFELNGLRGNNELVADDALAWLERAAERRELFDRIVLDPPSYSTTHQGRFSLTRDYERLAQRCFQVLDRTKGMLLACANHRGVTAAQLERWLRSAAEKAGVKIERIRVRPSQPDFPAAPFGASHMKALLVEVAPGRPAADSARSRRG